MSEEPEKRPAWSRGLWLLLYAALSAVEFVVAKLKDWVEERVTGKPSDGDGEEGGE